MCASARVFNCARCRSQVIICSGCDRGNRYCGKTCSQAARQNAQRRAARRYQRTRRGRFQHAERQRRYRARRNKVTHHSSSHPPAAASLSPKHGTITRSWSDEPVNHAPGVRCHFCQALCSAFVRLDFLHSRVQLW